MPPLTGAQRNLAPPAPRIAWYCPYCPSGRGKPHGHAQNAHAAMTAGVRHYLDTHDPRPLTPVPDA